MTKMFTAYVVLSKADLKRMLKSFPKETPDHDCKIAREVDISKDGDGELQICSSGLCDDITNSKSTLS